jgi:hypothetical protein
MSTCSKIAVKTENEIKSIYCHWDGYLSNNGKILLNHYTDKEKVLKLIELGDLSLLGKSTDKPVGHSFENRIKGYCVAYHRDRGESNIDTCAMTYNSLSDLINNFRVFICDYLYLFDTKEDYWKYYNGKKWIKLTKKNTTED